MNLHLKVEHLILNIRQAAGAVNHDDLVKEVENSSQNLSTDPISAAELVEQHPAIFTGSDVGARHHLPHMCYYGWKGSHSR